MTTHRTPLEVKLSAIAKSGNITAECLIGDVSYERQISHAIIIRNEGSCCSVQVGSTSYGEYDIDEDVIACAQQILDSLEFQEESGDFNNLEELSFVILDSGVYRLFLDAAHYTAYYDFTNLALLDEVLKTKLYEGS